MGGADEAIRTAGEISWIEPPAGWLEGARAGLSCRSGGTSESPYHSLNLGRSAGDAIESIEQNEKRFVEAMQLPQLPAKAKLEHGDRPLWVDRPGVYGWFDALLTSEPRLPLWLTVADCVPVFLAGPGAVGLVHCGWKGTAAGVVRSTLQSLEQRGGIPPAEVRAWIGPSIGGCCYPAVSYTRLTLPT
ncbi:MAG: laccase domain-containing protein, partial [Candidatus Eisenbacteria bacterium]|nr:laccase domain-containing protein [Candidatus Eisenbacteria bacterium]